MCFARSSMLAMLTAVMPDTHAFSAPSARPPDTSKAKPRTPTGAAPWCSSGRRNSVFSHEDTNLQYRDGFSTLYKGAARHGGVPAKRNKPAQRRGKSHASIRRGSFFGAWKNGGGEAKQSRPLYGARGHTKDEEVAVAAPDRFLVHHANGARPRRGSMKTNYSTNSAQDLLRSHLRSSSMDGRKEDMSF